MNLSRTSTSRRSAPARGVTLIECLVYISLVFVVLGFATAAFYRCFDNMKALRRNSDDITAALHAGELWRADIRSATRPVQFDATNRLLRIHRPVGQVAYKFADAQVLRQTAADAPWVVVLPRVENSQMQLDARNQVKAWRWELELKTLRQPATVRPLFTFIAVPGTAAHP
jgi:Tfp pilus assembly protein FimT